MEWNKRPNIILFDFEVYRYDTLLGATVITPDEIETFQLWDLDEIRGFYTEHKDDLWIGHNNLAYDNLILEAILNEEDPWKKSKTIINTEFRPKCHLDLFTYDLMCCRSYSLKMTELLVGKAMHTTDVDFNIDRPLTKEEKQLVEAYNRDDLDQTYDNFLELYDFLDLRLSIVKEFKLDKSLLTGTEAQLASAALGARQVPGIEKMYVAPKLYDTLQIKNQEVIDYYLQEKFRKVKTKENRLSVMLCGVPHQLGSGGIHAAVKQCHETDMLYLDVSGYYNLVMINYDLLPRTIPEEGKALYEYMYHEQLKLKGVDDRKRGVYKTILLAVFGASMNEHTGFYDPQVGSLITMTGQLFLVDLLEKLDGKVKLIQSNTDGIIVKPLATSSKEEVLNIVKDWCDRTHFVIKPKTIDEIWQRDVNCYCYRVGDNISYKGDVFIADWAITRPVEHEHYNSKEAAIIATSVVSYLLEGTDVETTVYGYQDDVKYYAYLTKKRSFRYCTYDLTDLKTNTTTSTRCDDLNRVFAYNNKDVVGMVYKYKLDDEGKVKKCKIPNLPDSVFIDNLDIRDSKGKERVQAKLDYQYYIDRAYEHLQTFIPIKQIKEIRV